MTPVETMFKQAAETFIRKVDAGTAHSTETYAELKAALAALEKREQKRRDDALTQATSAVDDYLETL